MSDEPSIHDYLDAAAARVVRLYPSSTKRKAAEKCSDRELARQLGITGSAVSAWRVGKAGPDDEQMCRLAEAADKNVEAALAWKQSWRSEGKLREAWARIARRLGGTAAALPFCTALAAGVLVAGLGKPSAASSLERRLDAELKCTPVAASVYYGKY
jgi:transcriptional regulator with XRE-family HTH domain